MYTVTNQIFNSTDPLMWVIFIAVFALGIISGVKSMKNEMDDETQEQTNETTQQVTPTTNTEPANTEPKSE